MIERVTISGLGVIERAELDLHAGFNVVTGETGAGKTMVVTAFGLLLGSRAEASSVRRGADKAAVDAELYVASDHPARQRAEEAGALLGEEDDAEPLLLGRAVSAKGRSRATVSGRAVPVSVLGEIGAELVTVHGQSDQLRLRSAAAQREALDRYAGEELRTALEQYQRDYQEYQSLSAELKEITNHEVERRREAEQLHQALEAIDAVDPQPGEAEALRAETLKLENLEALREAARTAQEALTGGDAVAADTAPNASALIEAASSALTPVVDQDEELAQTARQLSEVSTLVTDAANQLGIYAASLDDTGPERLAHVHSRRAEIDRLTRLYGPEIDDVLHWAHTARQRLDTLHSDSERIEELTQRVEELSTQLWNQAEAVRQLRVHAAEKLSSAVGDELTALAMPNARLTVEVTPTEELTRYGADTVTMLLAPHSGAEPMPLGKGASGGELSRVMLALEVVLAEQLSAGTFIFDEVDAGVGGHAAVQIGRRLATLAQKAQVICVTHLPQVAAYADQHIRVHKGDGGSTAEGVTVSDVRALSQEERVAELARMLAGQQDSQTARAHAAELLETATVEFPRSGSAAD
ncbi:DNA repair protein RecN [Nesterenkonia alba]|uniref:DNA repair protein RecN n=1 Tax=Nesterenkonia alba TaxID=515814 RepID=UPI0003B7A115|nr:DNA repair protein RecN [Nesterenkonia alba]